MPPPVLFLKLIQVWDSSCALAEEAAADDGDEFGLVAFTEVAARGEATIVGRLAGVANYDIVNSIPQYVLHVSDQVKDIQRWEPSAQNHCKSQ